MNTRLASILKNDIRPLTSFDTVDKALSIMRENSISSVVITDDKNIPIGIFTEHDSLKIVSKNLDKNITLESVMSKNVFCVKSDTYLHDAYMQMEKHSFKHLIVVDEDEKYLGVISEGDFVRYLGFKELTIAKSIKDVMNDYILRVSKDSSTADVAEQMAKHKQDYAIIVDGNIPYAVISERDITYYCLDSDEKADVSQVVSQNNFITINKDENIQNAAHVMEGHGIHQILVVDDNKELIGLITRHNVLKALHGAYFDVLIKTIENKNKNEQKLLEQKHDLWLLANHDQLTNLPNRFQLRDYIDKSISDSDNSIAMILIDLKKFKDINDSYGHDVGDEVLNLIAKKLTNFSDNDSMVARLGNNEFAIATNKLEYHDRFGEFAKIILNEITSPIELSNGITINLSSSIGVSVYPKSTNDPKDLLQHAGTALHEAKKDAVSTIKCYNVDMTKKIKKKTSYEQRLKNAIKNNELELYYQPQVHIETKKIVGVEALLRWNDSVEGIISPEIFIPIAEESGLINPIGEWVIQEACRFGKKCLDNNHRFTIAVNVSANQIKYQNIADIVSKALQKSGFEAEKLEIEITESSIMKRADEAIKTLHAIRALGVRIAIDDFGTGYSSLSYLKKFPIDVLKIDKSFIDDIPFSKDDMAIVVAIIEMGKALGYEVLAEGVETKEQLDFLEQKHCSLYQGFYKSKPLKAEEFSAFLE